MGKKLDNEDAIRPDFKGRFVSFFAGNPNYKEEKNNNFLTKYNNIKKEKDVSKYEELKKRILLSEEISSATKSHLLDIEISWMYKKKKQILATGE